MKSSPLHFAVASSLLLVHSLSGSPVEIDKVVKSVHLKKGWQVHSVTPESKQDVANQMPWALLKGPNEGETVTIVINKHEPGSLVKDPTSCCDSSHEYCPEGRPSWIAPSSGGFIHSLNCETTELLREGFLALEFTFITERKVGNLMAHGMVLFGDASVYIQHTSPLPITREIAQAYADDVMRFLAETSDPENLNRRQDPKLRRDPSKSSTEQDGGGKGEQRR